MKKLFVAAALVLGGFATQAATSINANDVAIVVNQEEFKEIAAEEVPKAITDALAKDYEGATLNKAYVNEAKEYKLEVTIGDQTGVLYANENGEWIQK
ncbi:hypothetical protein [Sinomicrobium weinanense]|uniref:DUF2874 domain-containing protein n=1 Tax=Sinomicrobium weinanense TaxID=2842200 RepID=A0A926JTF0_9FLAO|nr:hypothetical protein [Sinomicrobium weinanense]MBC9797165.1 hypothetical protein [Sinomicrobium weinanense]MBU3124506.1 hypothetical protein [Sinomicrobium weinanense]